MYLLRVNKNNIMVMKILDLYVLKGKGGFINYKFMETHFKLLTTKREGSKIIEINFDVPVADIASGRIKKGKNILVEKVGRDGLKYLGAEGDWETMMNYGITETDVYHTLPGNNEFKSFSEEADTIEYHESTENNKTTIEITMNDEVLGKATVDNGIIHLNEVHNDVGRKLIIDWLKSRGHDVSKLKLYDK